MLTKESIKNTIDKIPSDNIYYIDWTTNRRELNKVFFRLLPISTYPLNVHLSYYCVFNNYKVL